MYALKNTQEEGGRRKEKAGGTEREKEAIVQKSLWSHL